MDIISGFNFVVYSRNIDHNIMLYNWKRLYTLAEIIMDSTQVATQIFELSVIVYLIYNRGELIYLSVDEDILDNLKISIYMNTYCTLSTTNMSN